MTRRSSRRPVLSGARGATVPAFGAGLRVGRRVVEPWADTYHPGSNDDWEHVFSELPGPLMIPVILAWQIGRIATGSTGEPVQLSAIRLDALPDPFPAPGTPASEEEDFDRLGPLVRLPVRDVVDAVGEGRIADPETVALLFGVSHEIDHGV